MKMEIPFISQDRDFWKAVVCTGKKYASSLVAEFNANWNCLFLDSFDE